MATCRTQRCACFCCTLRSSAAHACPAVLTCYTFPWPGLPRPDRVAAQGAQIARGVRVCGRASLGAGGGGGAARGWGQRGHSPRLVDLAGTCCMRSRPAAHTRADTAAADVCFAIACCMHAHARPSCGQRLPHLFHSRMHPEVLSRWYCHRIWRRPSGPPRQRTTPAGQSRWRCCMQRLPRSPSMASWVRGW
jgi:hypothetical protein